LEAVERVPDRDDVEVVIAVHLFRASDHPPNVANPALTRVGASELDGLGLLIDGADLAEARCEAERQLARAAREVEQAAAARRIGAAAQFVEQRRGIRHPEPVVEARRPSIQVGAELGPGLHSPIFAPVVPTARRTPTPNKTRPAGCRRASDLLRHVLD